MIILNFPDTSGKFNLVVSFKNINLSISHVKVKNDTDNNFYPDTIILAFPHELKIIL